MDRIFSIHLVDIGFDVKASVEEAAKMPSLLPSSETAVKAKEEEDRRLEELVRYDLLMLLSIHIHKLVCFLESKRWRSKISQMIRNTWYRKLSG